MGARNTFSFGLVTLAVIAVGLLPLRAHGANPADGPGSSSGARTPVTLRLATGSVGGTFLPTGQDLAFWLARTAPEISVEVLTTAGSVDNLDRLLSGEADLAIVGSSPFREVLDGWGTNSDEARTLCVIGTLYMDAEQFVVRSSLVRAGTLLDLSGLLMYPGPHGSGGEIDTRRILTVLGIEPQFVYADERTKGYAAAAAALARGDFDAATFSGGVPIQAVTELFRKHPGEFQILPFSRHMLSKLQHYEADFEGVIVRKGSYPGMDEDVQAVGGPNLLIAAPEVAETILQTVDQAIRLGIEVPGEGLRSETSHPVLQALDLELWGLDPIGQRCLGVGIADLAPPSENASPR